MAFKVTAQAKEKGAEFSKEGLRREVVRLYKRGQSMPEIAKIIGLHTSTVFKWIPADVKHKRRNGLIARAARLYANRHDVHTIAKLMLVSTSAVQNYLKEGGVKFRTHSEWRNVTEKWEALEQFYRTNKRKPKKTAQSRKERKLGSFDNNRLSSTDRSRVLHLRRRYCV